MNIFGSKNGHFDTLKIEKFSASFPHIFAIFDEFFEFGIIYFEKSSNSAKPLERMKKNLPNMTAFGTKNAHSAV